MQSASARETRHAKPGDGPEARRIGLCPRPDGQFRQPFSSRRSPPNARTRRGVSKMTDKVEFWKIGAAGRFDLGVNPSPWLLWRKPPNRRKTAPLLDPAC